MSDLGALPPEVSSALIYSGPGASSLTSAAAAWNSVAAELTSTAQGLDTVVTQLASESWLGPTSAAMVAAVQPYVSWVSTTAGQAEHAAAQAQSAAAAFEAVFASVVPPPLIAANRAELAQAVQTNVLGLNNNVIAQLEAQYAEFWSQNASAMYGYAASSAAATKISSFTEAPTIANPAAALTSTATSATKPATSIQSYLQGILTNIQNRITSLTGPFIGPTATANKGLTEIWFLLTGQTILPTNLGALANGYQPFASFFYNTEGLPYFSVGMATSVPRSPSRRAGSVVRPRPRRPRCPRASVAWAVPPVAPADRSQPDWVTEPMSRACQCPTPGLEPPCPARPSPCRPSRSASRSPRGSPGPETWSAACPSEPVLRAEPARVRATDSNPPSWAAPCPRANPPHTPRPARLRASQSKLIRRDPSVTRRQPRRPFAAAGFLWCSPLQRG